jgi:hypothetical protein
MKHMLRGLLLAICTLAVLQPANSQIGVTVAFEPPALPVYEQPLCPGDGYLWTPGYWAYDADDGYYWIPGTWVLAPEPGYLWTPAWWGWGDGGFLFHDGYWATEVGFYGGINYGFGYFGAGFGGGRWDGGIFRYNTAVLNVNTTIIHNTYIDRTVVVNNTTINRVSYNGGQGGITARPTPHEESVAQQRHIPPVAAQTQHIQAARSNPQMRASANEGKPPVAATEKPGELSGRGVVAAREAGAPYHAPARGAEPAGATGRAEAPNAAARPANPVHAGDVQPHTVTAPNTGDPKLDQKYQQQQQKLVDKQNAEHQKLAQKQQQEDQKVAQTKNSIRQQGTEQRHQQQTQQLEQRHTQQTQQMQQRQAPSPAPRPR